MIKDYKWLTLKTSMSNDEMLETLRGGAENIAYVLDEVGNYVGCYTRKAGINRKSKVIIHCEEEREVAKEIFAENERIRNIPVISYEGKLLYQFIREFEDCKFESKEYWENRYRQGGTSGSGSYNQLAQFKAEIINQFIKKNEITSMIEWGCGDGNQLGLFEPIDYIGYDVSETAIKFCREKYEEDAHKKFFVYDGLKHEVDKADLAISLDVIFHLVEDNVFEDYMFNLFMSSKEYVCIYSCDTDLRSALHVRERKFTKYIEETFPEWKLEEFVKNRYPYCAENPDSTSISDFYFYRKNNKVQI